MPSFPCKIANCSVRCPKQSESDSDGSVQGDSKEVQDDDKRESSDAPKPDCFFVDDSAIEATKNDSIINLQSNAEQLQQQIDRISVEKEQIQRDICEKKKLLVDAIEKLVESEKSIRLMEAVIADKLHHFQGRIIELESKREDIFKNSGDEKVRELLEREIDEVSEEFERSSVRDEVDKNETIQQALLAASAIGDVIEIYRKHFNELPDDDSVAKLQTFSENTEMLYQLLNRPAKFCKDEAGERFYRNRVGEKVYKVEAHSSEYKLTADGNRKKAREGFALSNDEFGEFYFDLIKRKIYTKYHFEDGFGRFYVDVHGNRHYQADPQASEYALVGGNWTKIKDGTYETDDRGRRVKPDLPETEIKSEKCEMTAEERAEKQRNDDFTYIKETVGPAVRKGLAAVALHMPADPINYFANFLLHYRYNQQMFVKRDEELSKFLKLRDEMRQDVRE